MKTQLTLIGLTLLSLQLAATEPTASNVLVTGTPHVGATITGSYSYSDADGDLELNSIIQWYAADDASGTNRAPISGASNLNYTVQSAYVGKYISFAVSPFDENGEMGIEYFSPTTEIIRNYSDLTYNNNASYTVSGTQNYASVTANNTFTLTIPNGDSLIIWLNFTVKNTTNIIVEPGGYFEVKGNLVAQNNPIIRIEGNAIVDGDLNVSQNATFNVTEGGLLDVMGSLITNGGDIINVEGALSIAQDLNIGQNSTLNIDMDNNGLGSLAIGGNFIAGNNTVINGYGPVSVLGTVSPNVNDVTTPQLLGVVLPIELISFDVYTNNNKVTINWRTASEKNNDYFSIERSSNGIDFKVIETITGAGNSERELAYYTDDNSPNNGINYYRLKQTDYDGKYSYSDIEAVKFNGTQLKTEEKINVYANPALASNGIVNLDMPGTYDNQEARISVFSYAGQIVISKKITLNGSYNSTIIDISDLDSGNYIIIVNITQNNFQQRLVVM